MEFWKSHDFDQRYGWIHPEDVNSIKKQSLKHIASFDEYAGNTSNLYQERKTVHSGLIPVPYTGDLAKASIFILMLNPGFDHNDYFSEEIGSFRDALLCNLRQQNFSIDYPFLYLDPRFCHTSGGRYWLRKFDSIIKKLHNELNIPFDEATKLIARNVCTLELFPYHSQNFGMSNKATLGCASVKAVKRFLNDMLAERPEVSVFCLRKPDLWEVVEEKDRVLVLPNNLRRSASIGAGNIFGGKIYDKLKALK